MTSAALVLNKVRMIAAEAWEQEDEAALASNANASSFGPLRPNILFIYSVDTTNCSGPTQSLPHLMPWSAVRG